MSISSSIQQPKFLAGFMAQNLFISGSVGRTSVNFQQDTRAVQMLLNRHAATSDNLAEVKEDGIMDLKTIQAIEAFQKEVLGDSFVDGRIEVDGPTWRALLGVPQSEASEAVDQ